MVVLLCRVVGASGLQVVLTLPSLSLLYHVPIDLLARALPQLLVEDHTVQNASNSPKKPSECRDCRDDSLGIVPVLLTPEALRLRSHIRVCSSTLSLLQTDP